MYCFDFKTNWKMFVMRLLSDIITVAQESIFWFLDQIFLKPKTRTRALIKLKPFLWKKNSFPNYFILFVNSYSGGTRPWAPSSSYRAPSTDDGYIEVIGLTTYQLVSYFLIFFFIRLVNLMSRLDFLSWILEFRFLGLDSLV